MEQRAKRGYDEFNTRRQSLTAEQRRIQQETTRLQHLRDSLSAHRPIDIAADEARIREVVKSKEMARVKKIEDVVVCLDFLSRFDM